MTADNSFYLLVRAFDDPVREAEAVRYHQALLKALNETHEHGEQDGIAVMEAMARVLAQLTAGGTPCVADGFVTYVARRATELRQHVIKVGAQADHKIIGKETKS